MQERWVEADNGSAELVISGGEVCRFRQAVEYDYKLVSEDARALSVSLRMSDEIKEDTFQRANITGLVITPAGEFHAYNVKFACHFVRADHGTANR